MANKNLGTATAVSAMLKTNSVLVEVGGSVRRITLDNLLNSINSGDDMLLRQVAWGVPMKQITQSSPAWGSVGNSGMWSEYKALCGRYLVTNDGKAAKLMPTDSSKYADGSTLDETKGHVMWMSPRLYYRVIADSVSGDPYLWMSQMPIGGKYIEAQCIGAYKGSMSGTALTSRSGVAPAGSKTINAFWTAAQVNGKQWGLVNYDFPRLMMMLALSEYGNPNIQDKLGHGVGGSVGKDLWTAASALLTGATKSMGDAWGYTPITLTSGSLTGENCSRVNVMGIEDPYGWQWEMIQGVYFGCADNSAQSGSEIYIYEGNRIPSTAELAATPSGKYRQLARVTSTGYIKEMILGDFFDLFSKVHGGGSTSYWCDQFYSNTAGQLLLWGGTASHGATAGLGCAISNSAFSSAASYLGARLAYYGPTTVMHGSELIAAVG